jgi:hypothetical protein
VIKEKHDALKIPNDLHHQSDPRRGSGMQLVLNWLDEYLIEKVVK